MNRREMLASVAAAIPLVNQGLGADDVFKKEMRTFKVGEVVAEKRGGPIMTVHDDRNNGTYGCMWFAAGSVLLYDTFAGRSLKIAKMPGEVPI